MSHTPEVARDLAWFSERYPLEFDPRSALDAAAEQHMCTERAVARIMAGECSPRRFDLALPPRQYQAEAAELCLTTGGLLVGDELGLGKTVTALTMLCDPAARPALIATEAHLVPQWERELAKFTPGLSVHTLRKGQPYPLVEESSQGRLFAPRFPDVILTTWAKLYGWSSTLAPTVRTCIWDECQALRHRDSNRWSGAKTLADSAAYRMGLSGTPFYNYGGEMHNVMECIRPGALGTADEFVREWCRGDWGGPAKAQIRDPRTFGKYLRSEGLFLRRTRDDVGRELPAKTKVVHSVETRKDAFKDIEDRVAELARIILASTGHTGQERREAAGEIDWKLRQATGIAKAPSVAAFARMLIESGEPKVIVFGWHKEVYRVLESSLADLGVVRFTGDESPAQKEKARSEFVDGSARVMLMSLRSGSGLDGLQAACASVVFAELDWSPGVHEQCEGRVFRDGQTRPVFAYYLVSDGGSDPVVADVLGLKASQISGVRDPSADVLGTAQTDENRIKRLAEDVLARSRR